MNGFSCFLSIFIAQFITRKLFSFLRSVIFACFINVKSWLKISMLCLKVGRKSCSHQSSETSLTSKQLKGTNTVVQEANLTQKFRPV